MSFNGRYDDLRREMLDRGWTEEEGHIFQKIDGSRSLQLELTWELFLSRVGLSGFLNFAKSGVNGFDTKILINNFREIGSARGLEGCVEVVRSAEIFDAIARAFFSIESPRSIANPGAIHRFNIQLVRYMNHEIAANLHH